MSPDTPLVFLHLFKCAGTSVHDYLCSVFDKKAIYPGRHVEDFNEIVPGYSVYSGHMHLRQWNNVSVKPHFVIWIRHPVQRVASAYYYLASLPPQNVAVTSEPAWIRRLQTMSLAQCIETNDIDVSLAVQNGMSHFLYPAKKNENTNQWRQGWLARKALWRFSYIGIAEETERCLACLANRFNLPPPEKEFRSNTYLENSKLRKSDIAARNPLTQDIVRSIERRNQSDLSLYKRARLLNSIMM